jgi:hypothetical protein
VRVAKTGASRIGASRHMPLKYHHTTFRFLGEEPRVSGETGQKMKIRNVV